MREIVPNLGSSTFEKNTTTLANENRGFASDHAQQIDFQTSMDKQFEADDIEKNQPSSSDDTCLASNTDATVTDLIIKKSALANTGNSWESAGSVVHDGQNNKKTAQTLDANPLVSPDNQAANITIRFSANYSFDSLDAKSIYKSLNSTANQAFTGEPAAVETDKIFQQAASLSNIGKIAAFSTKDIQTDVKTHFNNTQVLKMHDAQWKSSISNKIMDNINAEKQNLELVVAPKSLGKIAIQISSNGDLKNIKMFTDNTKTTSLLRAALPDIEKKLSDAGLNLVETSAGWKGFQINNALQKQITKNEISLSDSDDSDADRICMNSIDANNVGISRAFSTKNGQTDIKSHLHDTQDLKMHDAQWKSSISNKIMDVINAGKQALELVVAPKSLGKIAIQISSNGDLTSIKMFTDNAKTAGLLGAALPEIEENLREVGLDLLETNTGWNGSQTKHGMRQNTENEISPSEREEQKSQQEDAKTTSKLSSVDYHIGEYSYEV